MASLVLGTVALQRALHGRIGLWPLSSLLFVYNSALYWGFVGFLFTLSLALLAFAAWVASEPWPARRRIVIFSLPASLLFIFHLFGFGVYGLLVASYELGRPREQRRRSAHTLFAALTRLAQFVPAGLMWLATLGNGRARPPPRHPPYHIRGPCAPPPIHWPPP